MVNKTVKADVKWWCDLAKFHNRILLMTENNWSAPDMVFSSDNCLTGGGAFCQETGNFIAWEFPDAVTSLQLHINELECLMVTVALNIWGNCFARKRILIYCDNETTVRAINLSSCRSLPIQCCLRRLHHLEAQFHCEIRVKFICGRNNRISDALS